MIREPALRHTRHSGHTDRLHTHTMALKKLFLLLAVLLLLALSAVAGAGTWQLRRQGRGSALLASRPSVHPWSSAQGWVVTPAR